MRTFPAPQFSVTPQNWITYVGACYGPAIWFFTSCRVERARDHMGRIKVEPTPARDRFDIFERPSGRRLYSDVALAFVNQYLDRFELET